MLLVALMIAPQAAPPPTAPARIDLTRPATPAGCGSAADGEILVCARPRDADRLPRIPERYIDAKLRPEIGVLGGKASVRAEQRATLAGSAPALMFNFTIPF